MTIEFRCTDCQHLLRTKDDKAGLTAACPSCGVRLTVPQPATSDFDTLYEKPVDTPQSPPPHKGSRAKDCPMCGAKVSRDASNCPDCGESIKRRFSPQPRRADYSTPHRGGLILGLAIGGFFCCCFLSIAALVMGHQDLAEIDAGRMDPAGHGLTLAGVIVAWAHIALTILAIILQIVMAVAQNGL